MPDRQPLRIKVSKKLPIRVTKKLPIKVKARDEPAMSMFQRAVKEGPSETPAQRKKREAFTRRADDLRRRIAERDPSMTTQTRLPYRQEEATLYDLVFMGRAR